jgi:D-alanyl-D-alanine carboxypeptidase
MIVERVTAQSLGRQMRTRIFGPLEMRHTSYRPLVNTLSSPFTRGYVLAGTAAPQDVTVTSPTIAGAAGAIVSTQPDVMRFFGALFGGRVLPKRSVRLMRTPTPQSLPTGHGYGLGIEQRTTCGATCGHAGEFPGYESLSSATPNGRGRFTLIYNAAPGVDVNAFPSKVFAAARVASDALQCAIQRR